jgi:demethoxyubiquinone hydroxylase (CLK1/Coq7/Cat5 family)
MTVCFVEEFVDTHYQHQIDFIQSQKPPLPHNLHSLVTILDDFRKDEVDHGQEARSRWGDAMESSSSSPSSRGRMRYSALVWRWIVGSGSALAVKATKMV